MELLAHKDFKETQEKPESPDQPARWVPVAHLVPQANQEMMVNQENLVIVVNVDQMDLREPVDFQEHQAYLESRDTEVTQVLTVLKENLELLDLKVRLARPERAGLLDQWVLVVYLVNVDAQDLLELLVLVEMMAYLVLLVLRVLWV